MSSCLIPIVPIQKNENENSFTTPYLSPTIKTFMDSIIKKMSLVGFNKNRIFSSRFYWDFFFLLTGKRLAYWFKDIL